MSDRKEIRLKVADILGEKKIPGIEKTFKNRQQRIAPEEMPCLIVYTKSESSEISIGAPREYKRTLKLAVDIAIIDKGDGSVDDLLDDVADEVEQRLFENETLDGLASDVLLSDTEIDFIAESENVIGLCRITFDVIYYTKAPVEQDGLDNFARYTAEYKTQGNTPDTPKDIDQTELSQV